MLNSGDRKAGSGGEGTKTERKEEPNEVVPSVSALAFAVVAAPVSRQKHVQTSIEYNVGEGYITLRKGWDVGTFQVLSGFYLWLDMNLQ